MPEINKYSFTKPLEPKAKKPMTRIKHNICKLKASLLFLNYPSMLSSITGTDCDSFYGVFGLQSERKHYFLVFLGYTFETLVRKMLIPSEKKSSF